MDADEKEQHGILAKTISVAIYTDYEIHELEIKKTQELIKGEKEAEYIYALVLSNLKRYEENKNKYITDELEVVEYILSNHSWKLVEIAQQIYLSDKVWHENEKTLLKKVIDVKLEHDAIARSIKIARDEQNKINQE